MTAACSPWVPSRVRSSSASAAATTSTIPIPQLKVRNNSGVPAREPVASQPNTGAGVHVVASSVQRTPRGSTRGRFSGKPPPVMCASALTLPVRAAARQLLTYSLVGVRSASASDEVGANGAGASHGKPARSTTRRTSEKPLEWTPEEVRPRSTSPGAMSSRRGRIAARSTAPTAKPARS
eukprot:scaffold221841_cov28-Tisochrysis_lutea.AAC.4